MIKLKDLTERDGYYYIGHLYDIDGDGWVNKQEAIQILKLVNQ